MTMRGKRGGERSGSYRGWSRQQNEAGFFGSSSTTTRRADDSSASVAPSCSRRRQFSRRLTQSLATDSAALVTETTEEEEFHCTSRDHDAIIMTKNHAFFVLKRCLPSPIRSRRSRDEKDDVDALSSRVSGVQLLLPRRDEEDAASGKEPRTTTPVPNPKERKGGVMLAARSTHGSASDKGKKEQGPVILVKEANMVDGVKFVSDSMDICEQLLEFLSSESSDFNVISAIGPQGAGKSTILSMIGGNNSQDMYRQYIFRPASREALESSRHQTTRIHAYITKSKQIFLDCQASNCASVLDETLRYSRSSLTDGRYAVNSYIETVKLIAFLIQVSHTVLLCSDWLIDIEIIKVIRTAEMFRANFEHVSEIIPHYNATRKVNLVVLHTRAKSSDFSDRVLKQYAALVRAFFSDSRRIRVSVEDEFTVFPLADIKPRKDSLSGSFPSTATVEKVLDSQEIVDFDTSMRRLRVILAQLPRDRFSTGEHEITERQWYLLAKTIWNDPMFDPLLEQYKGYL